ncbi:hypothetical protein Lpp22_2612 [Lacticaseibacillus paracasei subsp. paracasei Lpp22]|uniref:Uncharacterized protein n=2 Tax=Lacticaseibacillus paracasei subsp. paracasei TaxID=47714 RepID=A0A806K720_LACPA|nr:Hypothetical protein LOCK919_0107 [Lacticaseibacillus paracasei]AGT63626.1 hypothetical protein LBPG_03027 [Lacticaseibacillus paracasei subsp. paracasei 8700:2]EPC22161.1 hypothetical protein Lpp22_2612 [Lacticaseibacillus paracasei subsp. paracasei Lpp22]
MPWDSFNLSKSFGKKTGIIIVQEVLNSDDDGFFVALRLFKNNTRISCEKLKVGTQRLTIQIK